MGPNDGDLPEIRSEMVGIHNEWCLSAAVCDLGCSSGRVAGDTGRAKQRQMLRFVSRNIRPPK